MGKLRKTTPSHSGRSNLISTLHVVAFPETNDGPQKSGHKSSDANISVHMLHKFSVRARDSLRSSRMRCSINWRNNECAHLTTAKVDTETPPLIPARKKRVVETVAGSINPFFAPELIKLERVSRDEVNDPLFQVSAYPSVAIKLFQKISTYFSLVK